MCENGRLLEGVDLMCEDPGITADQNPGTCQPRAVEPDRDLHHFTGCPTKARSTTPLFNGNDYIIFSLLSVNTENIACSVQIPVPWHMLDVKDVDDSRSSYCRLNSRYNTLDHQAVWTLAKKRYHQHYM